MFKKLIQLAKKKNVSDEEIAIIISTYFSVALAQTLELFPAIKDNNIDTTKLNELSKQFKSVNSHVDLDQLLEKANDLFSTQDLNFNSCLQENFSQLVEKFIEKLEEN